MDAQHPWMALARFLGAPDRLARLVSSSLYRAQWSEAVALRQAFQLHDPVHAEVNGVPVTVLPFAIQGLTASAATRAKVIAALEACVREKVLTRKDATAFEEHVLAGMDAGTTALDLEAYRQG